MKHAALAFHNDRESITTPESICQLMACTACYLARH